MRSILDDPAISGRYLFPQDRNVDDPFRVNADGAELACYHRIVDIEALMVIHFHGNGEAVADYVPFLADVFTDMGLNSLFVEYREYGGSTGHTELVAMLGDGEAAMNATGVVAENAIVASKIQLVGEDLGFLRTGVPMEEKVGKGLGRGKVLQRQVPQDS
tara:strand:+ start:649 stop:1128 length:480 start_codon:yes stop_codon:yes gene_type:complete